MARKFNIHDWQSRHIFEQNDFIPDLEDDDLKRSKIQQMMDKEKGGKEGPPYISAAQLFDNIIKGLETSGPYQDDIMFSKERALEIMEMVIDIEESEISPEAALDQAMEKEDELDEQNVTGTGASMQAGEGMGHFGKKKKRNYMNEEEQEETDQLSPDKLGKDGEIEPDVSYVQNMLTSKINTSEEWMELFYTLIDHSQDIKGLNSSTIKSLLQQSIREI